MSHQLVLGIVAAGYMVLLACALRLSRQSVRGLSTWGALRLITVYAVVSDPVDETEQFYSLLRAYRGFTGVLVVASVVLVVAVALH